MTEVPIEFQTYFDRKLLKALTGIAENDKNILRLDQDDYLDQDDSIVIPEIVVPDPIRVFYSEVECNNLILPDTLEVLLLFGSVNVDCKIQFPTGHKLKQIVIQYTNIVTEESWHSFIVGNGFYLDCKFNGVNFRDMLHNLYIKYFDEPIYTQSNNLVVTAKNKEYPRNNTSDKLNKLLEYELRIEQGREFCKNIKQELIANVWRPDNVNRWIEYYGMDKWEDSV